MSTPELQGPPVRTMFGADFDALRTGDSYESPGRSITTRDVSVFADLTGDHHPIHVDPVWAAAGPFGKPIAHGLLILSCAVGSLPLDPDRVIALRRIRDVVFKRPLAAGDSIVVGCKVTGLKPIDDGTGLVECEWRIADRDRKLIARAIAEILWDRGSKEPHAGRHDSLDPVQADGDALQVLI